MKKEMLRNQSGEVMLEASIVLVSVLILLFALLSLTFLFYQESMMTAVASEIASEIAENYRDANSRIGIFALDDGQEEVNAEKNSSGMFRMNFGKRKHEDAHKARAEKYAKARIALATLGIVSDKPEVFCDFSNSGIGRGFVKVTVKQNSTFFLSGVLDMIGITKDGKSPFGATAYAECVDMMGYSSMVNFTAYGSSILGQLEVANAGGELYSSIKELVQKLIG